MFTSFVVIEYLGWRLECCVTPPCLMDRYGELRSPLAPWASDSLRDAGHSRPEPWSLATRGKANCSEEKWEVVEGFFAVSDMVDWKEQETEQVALLLPCHI